MRRKIGSVICAVLLICCAVSCADSAIEWNGHTYKLFTATVSWPAAKLQCEKAGGHLVAIETEEEQNFICKQIMNHRGEVFWIGLSDKETEGKWVWVNGEKAVWQFWGPGEPDNEAGVQDYVCIHTVAQNWGEVFAKPGQWDDDFDDARHGYICEWDTPIR